MAKSARVDAAAVNRRFVRKARVAAKGRNLRADLREMDAEMRSYR